MPVVSYEAGARVHHSYAPWLLCAYGYYAPCRANSSTGPGVGLATGAAVIKCPSPLNVLNDTHTSIAAIQHAQMNTST
jgi:hypothetical protein